MNIILNGAPATVETDRLDQVLAELGYANAVVATAVNSEFVRRDLRDQTTLTDGDRLEIIAPMKGG
ncbi:MAG: sulfur carrier protein ThiS [Pseudomonadota bacterium]